jgi:hypothetical protein
MSDIQADLTKVTRFEVIDHTASRNPPGQPTGWTHTRYGVSVALSLQDDGRTLKVFLTDSPVSAGEVEARIAEGLRASGKFGPLPPGVLPPPP